MEISLKCKSKKLNGPLRTSAKTRKELGPNNILMANKHMKTFSTSLTIKEIQIKTTILLLLILEWLTWQIVTIPNAGEDEEENHSYIVDENVSPATVENNLKVS